MEALLTMLREEAKLFDNAEAAAILLVWDRDGIMPDTAVYAAHRIARARAARRAEGKANAAARKQAKAAREATAKAKAEGEALVSAAQAARARLKAKLHRPH